MDNILVKILMHLNLSLSINSLKSFQNKIVKIIVFILELEKVLSQKKIMKIMKM